MRACVRSHLSVSAQPPTSLTDRPHVSGAWLRDRHRPGARVEDVLPQLPFDPTDRLHVACAWLRGRERLGARVEDVLLHAAARGPAGPGTPPLPFPCLPIPPHPGMPTRTDVRFASPSVPLSDVLPS